MTQPDSSTGGTPKRYYLAYGAALHRKHLLSSLRLRDSPAARRVCPRSFDESSASREAAEATGGLSSSTADHPDLQNPIDPSLCLPTAKLLAARLGPTKPLSSHTVLVPTAFLSFDMRGLPYLEPCFTSAIVEGVNDLGWSGLGGKEGEGEQLTKEEKEGNEGYRKWVWERCCPGLEFTGELPPRLEVSF